MVFVGIVIFGLSFFSGATAGAADAPLTAEQRATMCAERTALVKKIEQRLPPVRDTIAQATRLLESERRSMDGLRRALTRATTQGLRSANSKVILFLLPCGTLMQNVNTADWRSAEWEKAAVTCLNLHLTDAMAGATAQRTILEEAREEERRLLSDLFLTRDVMTELGCPPAPMKKEALVPTPIPEELLQPIPTSPAARTPPPPSLATTAQTKADPAGRVDPTLLNPFLGEWTGTATVKQATDPASIGGTHPYKLSIRWEDDQLVLRHSLGVIGVPSGYKVAMQPNRLRIDYSGPSADRVSGLIGAAAQITTWVDLQLAGTTLRGQTYGLSLSTYKGHHARMEALLDLQLTRTK